MNPSPSSPAPEPSAERAAGLVRFDASRRRLGIGHTQAILILALHAHGPSTPTDIAETLGVCRASISEAGRPLKRRGLISTGSHEDLDCDQRQRPYTLTDAGRAAADTLTSA